MDETTFVFCVSDIDECKTLKARCGNRCRNTVGSYYCDNCPRGFTEGRDGVCIGQLRPYFPLFSHNFLRPPASSLHPRWIEEERHWG